MNKFSIMCVFFVLFAINSLAYAGPLIPNTFSAGDVVSASKMNANFSKIESVTSNAITSTLTTIRSIYSDAELSESYVSEVVTASCATNEVLTGGSCSCNSSGFNSDTTNFGILTFCTMVGNSVIGTCVANSDLYLSYLYGPPVTAYAACTKVTSTVGSDAAIYSASAQSMSASINEPPLDFSPEVLETQDKISEMQKALIQRAESKASQ